MGSTNKFKVIVVFCIWLLNVPFIQAAYFQPCYYNVDYSVKIQRVNVFSEPTTREQDVLIRYKAYSDVHIPKGRVRVDTFLTSKSVIGAHKTESHSFCTDTECPIERGDYFDAEFRLNIPWNDYGSMSVLLRLVDQVNGREHACIIVNFDTYHGQNAVKAN
ncbi:hypothetical protein vseg_010152 [Gypsophila vaccaria]